MKRVNFTLLAVLGLLTQVFSQNVVITEISYNPPGVDNYEFVELYNNGPDAVQLEGWTLSTAVNFTFPDYSLSPGDYVVVCNDSAAFATGFGFSALTWAPTGGALNNTGETIVLSDGFGGVVDSVHYSKDAPWPTLANGFGPSLILCDVTSDNNVASNWSLASTATGIIGSGIELLANPGAGGVCLTGPVLGFQFSSANVVENGGDVFVRVVLAGGNAAPTTVTLNLAASSTGSASDFTPSLPITLSFPAGVALDTQEVTISIVDDTDIESDETITLELTGATNGATVVGSGFSIHITDNDAPLTGALLITGVFDAQPAGAGAKGIELKALQDIADLSIYGIGSANNGGGSSGEEIALPAISLSAGECVYVADNAAMFETYFGFSADATGTGASINGDDAIELFENGQVIDVFGDISYPTGAGATLPWNYTDGWVYRKNGSGPDGSIFDLSNWTLAKGELIGGATNAEAPTPFPVCSYSSVPLSTADITDDNFSVDFGTSATLEVLVNDNLPLAITTLTITTPPAHGTATVNGTANITYAPNAGYCGSDSFVYQVCDAGGCDEATVNITVECPTLYPAYDIADVTTVTGGVPDSLNVTAELHGIVYGIDFQGVDAGGANLPSVQFYINDGTGGISIFGGQSFGYDVQEGDEVTVRGKIVSFNCLTQLSELDTIIFESANNPLLAPAITTFLNESFESELVQFTNMELVNPSAWSPAGTGFNVLIHSTINPDGDTITMRIDNDCELFNMPAPVGAFHAIGIGGQFVTGGGGGCVSGYQFLPRYAADIILLDATNESFLAGKISFFPNPVSDQLYLKSDIVIDDVIMSNALGQQVLAVVSPSGKIDVSALQSGLYLITFRAEGSTWTSKFVKG